MLIRWTGYRSGPRIVTVASFDRTGLMSSDPGWEIYIQPHVARKFNLLFDADGRQHLKTDVVYTLMVVWGMRRR